MTPPSIFETKNATYMKLSQKVEYHMNVQILQKSEQNISLFVFYDVIKCKTIENNVNNKKNTSFHFLRSLLCRPCQARSNPLLPRPGGRGCLHHCSQRSRLLLAYLTDKMSQSFELTSIKEPVQDGGVHASGHGVHGLGDLRHGGGPHLLLDVLAEAELTRVPLTHGQHLAPASLVTEGQFQPLDRSLSP